MWDNNWTCKCQSFTESFGLGKTTADFGKHRHESNPNKQKNHRCQLHQSWCIGIPPQEKFIPVVIITQISSLTRKDFAIESHSHPKPSTKVAVGKVVCDQTAHHQEWQFGCWYSESVFVDRAAFSAASLPVKNLNIAGYLEVRSGRVHFHLEKQQFQ